MTDTPSPLTQCVTPERWAGLSMDFIGAGYVGLLVKNGRLIRKLEPGRHFSFALPLLEQAQIILVDSKIRNLDILSQGDFVSLDQYLLNISLSVMYQVIDPKRVGIELSDPIGALTSAIKDSLGVVVNQMRFEDLLQQGRVQIRDYILSRPDTFYLLGFNVEDVRVSDISFPQSRGIARQVEGLTARQEATHEALLNRPLNQAERTIQIKPKLVPDPPPLTLTPTSAEATVYLPNQPPPPMVSSDRKPLPPTMLDPNATRGAIAHLKHTSTGEAIALATNPFTIGREPDNDLELSNPHCSRYHARLEQVLDPQGNSSYQLVDLGSSNGTFLNNQRIVPNHPYRLKSGLVLRIGSDEWIFEVIQE